MTLGSVSNKQTSIFYFECVHFFQGECIQQQDCTAFNFNNTSNQCWIHHGIFDQLRIHRGVDHYKKEPCSFEDKISPMATVAGMFIKYLSK